MCKASVAVRFGIARIEADRLIKVGDGLRMSAQGSLCRAKVVVGFRIVWVEANRPIVVGDGLLVPA